jgi:hypothetical protein
MAAIIIIGYLRPPITLTRNHLVPDPFIDITIFSSPLWRGIVIHARVCSSAASDASRWCPLNVSPPLCILHREPARICRLMRQIFIAAARTRITSRPFTLALFPINDISSVLRFLIDQPGNHSGNATTPYQSVTLHRQVY